MQRNRAGGRSSRVDNGISQSRVDGARLQRHLHLSWATWRSIQIAITCRDRLHHGHVLATQCRQYRHSFVQFLDCGFRLLRNWPDSWM